MHGFATGQTRETGKRESNQETGDRVNRKCKTAPLDASRVQRGLRISRAKNMTRGRGHKEHPHTKKAEPREDLYDGELPHGTRHLLNRTADIGENPAQP